MHDSWFTGLFVVLSAVPGELPSKFTISKKPYIKRAGYVMQMSKCICLQIIHFGKSVLRS